MGLFTRRVLPPVERLMAAAGLPTGGGPVPMLDIVMDLVQRGPGRIAAVLDAAEDLLGGPADAQHAAVDFIEALQNTLSHGSDGMPTAAEVLPLRGPRTVASWEAVDRYWATVVDWCDATATELESAESLDVVNHRGLRTIIWPTCRRLPDGRRIDMSHVLLYQQATGEPMVASGPHLAQ